MAITSSPRLALTRWSADSDYFIRSQMDTSHANLEARAAGFFSGTDRSAWDPTVYVRSFFYDIDDGILYYSDGTDWQNLTEFGLTAAISANTPGHAAAAGTADNAARSDHVHAMPAWGATGDVATVQTTASSGDNNEFARIDHVHVLGANSVVSGTIASGAISNSNVFVAGVIDHSAIATGAVSKAKIATDQQIPSGVIWAYGGITTPPSGWIFCDGSSYSTSLYPDLFAVIGYSYGGSSGTFIVPDLCDRMPRGAGTVTTTLGVKAGANTVTIGAANLPNHTHSAGSIAVANHSDHSHLLNGAGAVANSTDGANHYHGTDAHSHSASLASNVVGMNNTVYNLFYGPSQDGVNNGNTDAGLFPDYWGGGPSPIPVQSAQGFVANSTVNVGGAAPNTGWAHNGTWHGHSLSGSTQGASITLAHTVSGNTGNPTGAVGTEMSILPKTQTVNYIIKL